MANEVDIIENNLLADFGQEVFDILLIDHSVTEYKKDGKTHNIFWATHDYEQLGKDTLIMMKSLVRKSRANILMSSCLV